jgi:CcmD family protein
MSQAQVLGWVMAVPLVTWIGFFAYLLMIDRSLRALERRDKDKDDL